MKKEMIILAALSFALALSGCTQQQPQSLELQGSVKMLKQGTCGQYLIETPAGVSYSFDLAEGVEKPLEKDVVKVTGTTMPEVKECSKLRVESLEIVKRNIPIVEKGDTVKVNYVGSLGDGNVFDTSIREEAEKAGLALRESYEPLEFTVGGGQMIQGFDEGVLGMKVGEEKDIEIPPEKAYGPYDPDWVVVLDKNSADYKKLFPLEPSVGFALSIPVNTSSGQMTKTGVVTNVDENSLTLDFNHRLAGKTLFFKIILKELKKAG